MSTPHTCPVCGGEGVVYVGGTSTSCIPLSKPCKPCGGQGVIWGPEGADKNWTLPANPLPLYPYPMPLDPMTEPPQVTPVDVQRLNEILSDFKKSIDGHLEQEKDEKEQTILDIINDPLKKTFKL